MHSFDNQIRRSENDSTSGRKGSQKCKDAPFIGEVADDFDLDRIVRVRGVADLGCIGGDI